MVNLKEEEDTGSRYGLRKTQARIKAVEGSSATAEQDFAAEPAESGSRKSRRTEKKRKIEEYEPNGNAMIEKNEQNGNGLLSGPLVARAFEAAAADPASGEKSTFAWVMETLRIFNKCYLQMVQEEKKRCEGQKPGKKNNNNNGSKSKKETATEDCSKRLHMRPDLKAISQMRKLKALLYRERRVGSIPGIDVGHQFFSRAEMVAVGFHHHWLNGIDYVGRTTGSSPKSKKLMGLREDQLPVAVSIVLSGQYEDDLDNCEEIVYTGQGGNDLLGNKRQIKDQELLRGNLGLKNCMEHSVPIRVTRGHKCDSSYVKKVYTYDGIYKVVNYWAEKGVSGFTVYKFRLRRLEGQPLLTTKEVCFIRGRIPKSISEIRGLMCKDITRSIENIPIPVTNLVDDPPILPKGFEYIKRMKFSKNIPKPKVGPIGCNCRGECTDSKSCACAKLNGGNFPYVFSGLNSGGCRVLGNGRQHTCHGYRQLVEPKAVVFECGPSCGCGPKCINRTSQTGPTFRFEVFRTPKKGWGVRSWDLIPAGAPICEYIGLLRRTDDLSHAADNSYVFDIDCLQTMHGLSGRQSRLRDVQLPSYLQKLGEESSDSVPFCIDAAVTGNFARFINHSCQPNVFVQCILSDHHDMSLARVMLIAADTIPPLKELTYDYGYALDSVVGMDGNIRQMACFCGADGCRKRLY